MYSLTTDNIDTKIKNIDDKINMDADIDSSHLFKKKYDKNKHNNTYKLSSDKYDYGLTTTTFNNNTNQNTTETEKLIETFNMPNNSTNKDTYNNFKKIKNKRVVGKKK